MSGGHYYVLTVTFYLHYFSYKKSFIKHITFFMLQMENKNLRKCKTDAEQVFKASVLS